MNTTTKRVKVTSPEQLEMLKQQGEVRTSRTSLWRLKTRGWCWVEFTYLEDKSEKLSKVDWGELYRDLRRICMGWVFKSGLPEDVVDDIVQNVMLKLMEGRCNDINNIKLVTTILKYEFMTARKKYITQKREVEYDDRQMNEEGGEEDDDDIYYNTEDNIEDNDVSNPF